MNGLHNSLISLAMVLLFSVACLGSQNVADLISEARVQEDAWTRETTEAAINLLDRAAVAARSAQDLSHLHRALLNSARLYLTLNDHERSLELAEESARTADSIGGIDERAESMSLLLHVALASGRTELAKKTAGALEAILPSLSSGYARWSALQGLGEYSIYHGSATNTVERFRLALDEAEKNADLGSVGLSSLKLGFALIRVGEPLDAQAKIESALELARSAGGRRLEAQSLFGMGFLLSSVDSKQEAIAHYRTAEQLYSTGPDHIGMARVLNGISTVYDDLGDVSTALRVRERALGHFEKADYGSGILATLPSLAVLYFHSGDESSSRDALDRAETLALELEQRFYLGVVKDRRGYLSFESGDHATAIEQYREALAIYEDLGVSLPRVKNQLGNSLARAGKITEARTLMEQALAENLRTQDHVAAAENLLDLALINRSTDPDAAVHYLERSFELAEKTVHRITNRRLRSSFNTKLYNGYETLISIKIGRGSINDESLINDTLILAESSRARTLTDLLRDGSPSHGDSNEVVRIRTLINAKADRLTSLLRGGTNEAEVWAIEGELTELYALLDEARATSRDASHLSSSASTPSNVEQLRSSLQEGEVLLEYFLGSDQSFLWAITPDSTSLHLLPPDSEIAALITELQTVLGARKPLDGESFDDHHKRIVEADAKYAITARQLSDAILGPVSEQIKGKRLILVPDGRLNYLPISSLPMPGSRSDEPILLTNEVVYQPSAQTYALLRKIGLERMDQPSKDLLVFSDPVFNASDDRLTGLQAAETSAEPYRYRLVESFSSLSRLPGSKTEAETVSSAVGRSELFMGFDATRDRLLSTDLADYKVIHLATHGFLDPERPELSSLIFSRYDNAGNQIDESVRMHDIYSMKLNADLVVLSACQTGTGKEIKGEGVMGLNAAFLQSGARSVVSTLWQVEDNAATELMKEFYGQMVSQGASPSAALRAAQIKLYNDPQFRSPFFWAAFTVHGDAAGPSPFKTYETRWLIATASIVILGFAAFLWLRRRYRTSKM